MKEQLELAALATGMPSLMWNEAHGYMMVSVGRYTREWNPRDNPGDGAEMEAAVGIDVSWFKGCVVCQKIDDGIDRPTAYEKFADHPTKQAARMAASLKVAEEVGRRMKEKA